MSVYTGTLRGYAFGGDIAEHDWQWTVIPTLGFGDYRGQRTALPGQHGTVPDGGDWGGSRVIVFELEHMSATPATAEAAEFALRAAFAPCTTGELVELTLEMQSGTFVLRGRPQAPEVIPVYGQFGCSVARVQFEATDPVLYSSAYKTAFVTMNAGGDGVLVASGGVLVASGGVLVAGGSGASQASALNAGSVDVDWQVRLVGPISNPRVIVNQALVTIQGDVPAGSTALLDSRRRSFELDNSIRPWISFGSQWSKLPAGVATTFAIGGDSGTGNATLTWRDGRN